MRKFDEEASKVKERVVDKASGASASASDTFSEKYSKFKKATKDGADYIPKPDVKMPEFEEHKETIHKVKGAIGGVSATFRSAQEKVLGVLPTSFGGDDKSWRDAAREVFGLRPEKKTGGASAN